MTQPARVYRALRPPNARRQAASHVPAGEAALSPKSQTEFNGGQPVSPFKQCMVTLVASISPVSGSRGVALTGRVGGRAVRSLGRQGKQVF